MTNNNRIKIYKGDITGLKVDAIVNAANNALLGGGGVDGAIHKAAGPELLEECKTLNGCPTGEARITKAYNLPSKFIIHTVGPIWHGGDANEEQLLTACYENSLKLAVKNKIETIAFPSISTGVYSYPKEPAAKTAITTCQNFLKTNKTITQIIFTVFSEQDLKIYNKTVLEL